MTKTGLVVLLLLLTGRAYAGVEVTLDWFGDNIDISDISEISAQVKPDSFNFTIDSPVNKARSFFSGFTIRPGLGTAIVDVFITRRSDKYQADLTIPRGSIGTPFLSFSILSPKYYFYEYLRPRYGPTQPYRLGVGILSETHTFSVSNQSLEQIKDFEPHNIGTSVSGYMSYLAYMFYYELVLDGYHLDGSITEKSFTFGLGYTTGLVKLDGSAIFGPERNTTGITIKDDVSTNTSNATGVTFLGEFEANKKLYGFTLAFLNFSNGLYRYNVDALKVYIAIPFTF